MTKLPADILQRAHELEARSPHSMVAVFSPTGDYLYASANHEQFIGYAPAGLASLKLTQLVAPEDQQHLRLGFMDTILHGKSVVITVRLQSKSGRLVTVKAEAWHALDPRTGQGYVIGRAAPTEPGSK